MKRMATSKARLFAFKHRWRTLVHQELATQAQFTQSLLFHSFIHSLIHPSIHSFIHSLTHSFIHSSIHPSIHSFPFNCYQLVIAPTANRCRSSPEAPVNPAIPKNPARNPRGSFKRSSRSLVVYRRMAKRILQDLVSTKRIFLRSCDSMKIPIILENPAGPLDIHKVVK